MDENIILVKSKAFAVRIINFYKFLCESKNEYIISKQLLRSGTSIRANCREASRAQTKADFIAKMSISLKEADETCYWLELLKETDYRKEKEFNSIYGDAEELVKMLVSIIKTAKSK